MTVNLKEILHVLAEGISLTGTARDDLHAAIDAHDAPAQPAQESAAPAEGSGEETG
jgi:hypothetical protein